MACVKDHNEGFTAVSKFQIAIVAVLLVVLTIVGLVLRLTTTYPGVEKISGVATITEDSIDRIVIIDGESASFTEEQGIAGGEVTLWKVNGDWLAGLEYFRYRTDGKKMQEVLTASEGIQNAELVSINQVNHEVLGVSDEHGKVVVFWNGQNLIGRFIVGDKAAIQVDEGTLNPWTPANRSCFLRREGEDEVYFVFCQRPDVFGSVLQQWISSDIAWIPSHEIEKIHFTYRDEEFVLKPFGSVWVVDGESTQEQANQDKVRDVLRQIQPVVLSDLPSPEEVQGLDFSDPDVKIMFTSLPDATADSFNLLFIKRGDDGEHYINVEGEPYVYIFSQENSVQLLKRFDDMVTAPTP